MKDLSGEIAQAFNPAEVEAGWFDWWRSCGYFRPLSDGVVPGRAPPPAGSKPFVILIPPPNVTGNLHIGHALTTSVQDAIIRWRRMRGEDVLYIPGTDHAGIATQVQVEKKIAKEQGKSRHDLGREEFTKQVWQWVDQYGGNILRQFTRLASSADISRVFFTLDAPRSAGVTEAFVRLAEAGLVTREKRLVNWSCTLKSAISDIEVEYIDVDKGSMVRIPGYDKAVEFGFLLHFAYKVAGSDAEVVVATTRPETILGDTAVCVHPDDKRYQHLKGAQLVCPFRKGCTIPLVFDTVLPNMEFGTGALKVTPAHDHNDYECSKRHNLPVVNIFTEDGRIVADASICDPEFHGQPRFMTRDYIYTQLLKLGLVRDANSQPPAPGATVEDLKKAGFGKVAHKFSLGTCSRSGDVVEPYLKPQWYIDCTSMAARSVAAVEKGELRIIPEDPHTHTWRHYLGNIRPWCVSRQLWWGHRVPAYRIHKAAGTEGEEEQWVVARSADEARAKYAKAHGLADDAAAALRVEQDEDVLDTWFSSGLLPFTACGWPDAAAPDLSKFFPGSLLETGHDILFFWVARMVMLSLQLTDRLPFTTVYLHAMVRDKDGKKMSKSSGNVIDPVDVIDGTTLEKLLEALQRSNLPVKEVERASKYTAENFKTGIPQCGSDALRICLLASTMSGSNVNLAVDKIVGYRQFGNKLWNAVRFSIYHALGATYAPPARAIAPADVPRAPLVVRWILSRLERAVQAANAGFQEYEFADVARAVHKFFLYELCDVFIELTKPVVRAGAPPAAGAEGASATAPPTFPFPVEEGAAAFRQALWQCLDAGLRMAHPTMPFVTEELWHRLPGWAAAYGHEVQSIMLAPYPQPGESVADDDVERAMTAIQAVIHAIRSVRAAYQLTKERPECVITVSATIAPDIRAALEAEAWAICALGGAGTCVLGSKPAGAITQVATPEIAVHVVLRGMVDVKGELAKLDKRVTAARKKLEGIDKRTSIKDYDTKVPADVREKTAQERAATVAELETLETAVTDLKSMQ